MYEKIKKICEEKNITGKELGEFLGLKKSPLTDWKNGKAKPTAEQIKMICEKFAISADYILDLNINELKLTKNEKEMLENFKRLPEREQIKFIGKIEEVAEKYKNMGKSSESKVG